MLLGRRERIVAHQRERAPRLGQLLLRVVERTAGAHVGMAGERGVGGADVIARLSCERLGRLVLAAVRGPDRRRARLDRLARRADRHLAGAVLLLERRRERERRWRRSPRAGPPRRLRRRAAPQRELGRAQLRHVAHLLDALGLEAPHATPTAPRRPRRARRRRSAAPRTARVCVTVASSESRDDRAAEDLHHGRAADAPNAAPRSTARQRGSATARWRAAARIGRVADGAIGLRHRRGELAAPTPTTAVRPAQHVELVIEVDDRVSRALTTRSQERAVRAPPPTALPK